MVKVSAAFKEAIEKAAADADLNMSEWVRQAVARACGYNLDADEALDGRGRPRKYHSEKEARKARARAEQERQQRRQAVVDAVMRQEKLRNVEELERWLTARGISLENEPAKQAV